ncbi:calcium/calmodulin-dependent protein kinase type II subunit beta-like [Seriola lalandi dorsalis]|uniref:calcium/calmodulin-dependent protein kinase type II subunit beta-like n=1 Tax=Seriola lalandi dorsalis TaxID=1841481 RepID=UPI000C6FC1A3|nr:calcium/calmodulin-dependent protein kinase type II subunit beta-like [Seriola lalandi dorsalis]XP_023251976.1 calcium/calmodulin-dependent protein kinase type II subunit beta-like [Seriola lalandi dorsalis]
MGKEQSTLTKHGYELQKETKNAVVATKKDDTFFIRRIYLRKVAANAVRVLTEEIEILEATSHPHILSCKNSFKDEHENIFYVVMDYCQGGNLAAKTMSESPQESEVLSWIVEIFMALRVIHESGLLHNHLTPENIFLTEFGILCLGDFGKIHEISKRTQSTTISNVLEIKYLPPEVFTRGTYDAKSDIWSVGCILYELCTQKPAFSAETTVKLIPKIIGGDSPCLPETFSPELCQLLIDIFSQDPQSRPTASEILERPFIINCLSNMSKKTVEELQIKLKNLREVADGLERVHLGTTIGSLTGGVIGAVGGVTSIVGLILAPFTLGASLIVTGVGVGVGALGGVTAGASNITNMVNHSSDRKAVRSILKEFEQKIKAVVTWLEEITNSLQNIRSRCGSADKADTRDTADSQFNTENLMKIGSRAGRSIGSIAELVRLTQVMNIGKIAAQASRAVRVAEVATGVLSGLFVAVDIFFIAMDAKEIHHIRQAEGAVMQETDTSEKHDQSSKNTTRVKSEIMRFVRSIREAADNLQKVLDEFESIISSIPSLGVESDLEWQDMDNTVTNRFN